MSGLTRLPSGLTVVSHAMPGLETAAVGLFADSGSRHEDEAVNGLAHLYEHMVFKGAGGRSARELSESIEDVGGELNAATERDTTSFTASVMAEHVPLAVELLADLTLRPNFDAVELEREKDVVLQELAEVYDTPSDLVFDELWTAAFADQPLGRPIIGNAESIARIGVDDLAAWRDGRFKADGLILAAAGKVEHEAFVALAAERFDAVVAGRSEEAPPATFTGGARVGRATGEQAQLTLGYGAPGPRDPDYLATRLFADIVGGGTSSRLFQSVREDRGLAYTVSAHIHPHPDLGLFYIHAATAPRQSAAAGQLIEEEVERAATDLTQRELDRVRTQARAGLLMHLETPWGQAAYAARQLATHGRLVPPAEIVAALATLTVDAVRAAGAQLLAGPRARATIGVPAVRAA